MTEARTDRPQRHPIHHPASHFREGEEIFATGFVVHEEMWRERADREM